MKVTKFGHSCLLIQLGKVSILTDPGKWNQLPEVETLDAILITHEHGDHCDIDQLKALLEKHGSAQVITHQPVGKILSEQGIQSTIIHDKESLDVKGVSVQSFGTKHATIYGGISPCQNTGYLINGELFAPGDALHDIPPAGVRILALPSGGPWMRLSEAIDYAKSVRPAVVFPIHDAMYIEEYRGELVPRIVGGNLKEADIEFVDMAPNSTHDF